MRSTLALVTLALAASVPLAAQTYKVGDTISEFTLPDLDGKKISIKESARGKKAIVLNFWSKNCPFTQSHESRFAALDKKWRGQGVAFFNVSSNKTENQTPEALEEIKIHLKSKNLEFPMLVDLNNLVANAFGADVTPTVFVLDAETLKIRYAGAVTDDPRANSNVTHDYVDEALTAVTSGKLPAVSNTRAEGCTIKRVKS